MEKLFHAMEASPLFVGIDKERMTEIIRDFNVRRGTFGRGDFILRQGERAKGAGLVLSGRLHIIREDFLGNREILTEISFGEVFDEVYALLPQENQSVSVYAAEPCEVAFFPVESLLAYNELLGNLLHVMAQKNLMLTRKMAHLSKKTIRQRIVSYLSDESLRQGSLHIKIPFNRQQLADYLCVERSALSRELSKMRREGLIQFAKNRFTLNTEN